MAHRLSPFDRDDAGHRRVSLLPLPQGGLDLIEINARRYWSTLERSAQIGVGRPGGLARVALSDADREMRDQFVAWCREAGCGVSVDAVGNIFARRPGKDDSLPPIVVGAISTPR